MAPGIAPAWRIVALHGAGKSAGSNSKKRATAS
jgi:hypothetical protein